MDLGDPFKLVAIGSEAWQQIVTVVDAKICAGMVVAWLSKRRNIWRPINLELWCQHWRYSSQYLLSVVFGAHTHSSCHLFETSTGFLLSVFGTGPTSHYLLLVTRYCHSRAQLQTHIYHAITSLKETYSSYIYKGMSHWCPVVFSHHLLRHYFSIVHPNADEAMAILNSFVNELLMYYWGFWYVFLSNIFTECCLLSFRLLENSAVQGWNQLYQ